MIETHADDTEPTNEDEEVAEEEPTLRTAPEHYRRCLETALAGGGDPDPVVRKGVLSSLTSLGFAVRLQLIEALVDEDADIRHRAAASLGFLGFRAGIEPLLEHLRNDPAKDVRAACAIFVSKFQDPRIEEALLHALGDEEARVVSASCLAVGSLGLASAAPRLLELLNHPDTGVRNRAVSALQALGVEDPRVPAVEASTADEP